MVAKTKQAAKKGKVKVGKLKVNKETIKDLSNGESKRIKGGNVVQTQYCQGAGPPAGTQS